MKIKHILLFIGSVTIFIVILFIGRYQVNTINTRYYDIEESIDSIIQQQEDSLNFYKEQIANRDSIIRQQVKDNAELQFKYIILSDQVDKLFYMFVEASLAKSDTVR